MLRKHNNGYKECDQKNLAGAGNILKAVLCGEDRKLDRWLYKSVTLNYLQLIAMDKKCL